MQHLVIFLTNDKNTDFVEKKSVYRLFFGVYDIEKIQFFRRHLQTEGQRPPLAVMSAKVSLRLTQNDVSRFLCKS